MTRRDVMLVLGASATALAVPPPAQSQQLVTVRIGSTLDDAVTPILYGLQVGIFKQLGLDVQLQSFGSGAALTSAVVGGALDVGKSSQMALIAARVRGVPLKIIAGAAQYRSDAPTSELIVAKNSPIKSAADLNGKTVAASALKALDMIAAQAWVDQHGGDSSTLKFVELPNPAMVEALGIGRIDAATPSNPALQEALDSGKARVLGPAFDAIAKRFLIAGWFCTEDYIAKNTDVVRKFADGVRRASLYTNAHHAETVPLLAGFSHIDPGVISRMNRLTNATSLNAKDLQPSIDAAVKYKVVDRPIPAQELLANFNG